MRKIFILSFAILLSLSLASCAKPKTSISADEFQAEIEAAGFEVVDASDGLSEDYAGVIEAFLVASNEEDDYQIEFFVTADESKAIRQFNNVKDNFAAEKENSSSNSSVSVSNYSKYKQTSNGQYYVVSRIDNTFLYVVTTSENKDSVDSALTALGY